MLDKGMTHIPDRTEQDSASFHHTAQKGVHFKTEELFISGISYFVFSEHGWPQVDETAQIHIVNKWGVDYCTYLHLKKTRFMFCQNGKQDFKRTIV